MLIKIRDLPGDLALFARVKTARPRRAIESAHLMDEFVVCTFTRFEFSKNSFSRPSIV